MAIWMVHWDAEGDYAAIGLKHKEDYRLINRPNFGAGQPTKDNYVPLEAMLLKGRIGDFSYLNAGLLVCTVDSYLKIERYISTEVEVLPLAIPEKNYVILNVVNVIDCLDEQSSELLYFANSRNVKDIRKFAFREELTEGNYLFKLPEVASSHIFSTSAFYELVASLGLTGLIFEPPYSLLDKIGQIARSS